jgi:NAD(P)-dependent dehydrogenase (short-subunit alcohol dehydrogenase family)
MTPIIFDLEGKTAVVIGGTSGIGRILSLGLADAGADVIASARCSGMVSVGVRLIFLAQLMRMSPLPKVRSEAASWSGLAYVQRILA